MSLTVSKIDEILKQKKLSRNKLSILIDCTYGALNQMVRGERPFSEKIIEKILPILEVSHEEFDSWILADAYPKEILELAFKHKIEIKKKKKELILTIKIDSILKQRNVSRTTLSKEINHSQSGLNRVITGKEPLSKTVRSKLARAFNISEDEIISWVVADKYSLEVIELAISHL